MQKSLELRMDEMSEQDTDRVVQIISDSMNPNEGRWARDTINGHYSCKKIGMDDGRLYFVAKIEKDIVGICGLHRYTWGPEDRTWLGWFAVDPKFQRQGIGNQMMTRNFEIAKQRGFKKMFVETYSDADFEKARNFYEKFGFKVGGEIRDYIREGVHMVIFARDL